MTPQVSTPADCYPPRFIEQQVFPRRRARGLARFRLENRPFSPGVRASLQDISQDGIGVVISEPFSIGAMVELELEAPAGNYRLVRLAEVRWVKVEENGKYRLGCQFAQRLAFGEMQRFV
jgi:PilZ domain